MAESYVTKKNLLKFLACSTIGVMAFLVPIPQGESFTTSIDFFKNALQQGLGGHLTWIVTLIILSSALISTLDFIWKPGVIRNNHYLSKAFVTTPFYLVSKIVGAVIVGMVVFQVGPDLVISGATGGTMVGLSETLFCIVVAFSFILPFLTECGIMEFLGVLLKPVVHLLFRVPGRASVDLMASWFGASNAAVILTSDQYTRGFYTQREAGYIMTNFSLVSIPFCLLIADTLGITSLFPAFYLTICVVGFILAVIMARIPPITSLKQEYKEGVSPATDEEVPPGTKRMTHALEQSCARAQAFSVKDIVSSGLEVAANMLFDLIPIVVAWGTFALIIAEHTPIFTWLSYPVGVYLDVLGVEYAYQVAPATLVGFADMFIPALLVQGLDSVKTKFIIGVLSLVQIIYLTEVGAIIIKSEIPLKFGKLLVIFLQRTLLAIPLIVLMANLLL